MTISMYQVSVPVFVHMLNNLAANLKKGEEFAAARSIEPEVLLNSRLAPDMFPLSKQIQIATDAARRCVARLTADDVTEVEDNEKTFAEFYDRINKTIAYLNAFKPEQVDGTEEKPVTVEIPDKTLYFTGQSLLLTFSLPHFLFHCTTAYNILRHNGVILGKADYLGKIGTQN